MALERPVETILSGPAASVVGAGYLVDLDSAFVIDMGGTTTDIAAMRGGRPVLNPEGARIDGWQIMIEAIDARTTGLGGDSDIRLNESDLLSAGPQRVVPLCLLAEQYPAILDILQLQINDYENSENDSDHKIFGRFILQQRQLPKGDGILSTTQQEIWEKLDNGPVPLLSLTNDAKYPPIFRRSLEELMGRGLVVAGAFTPTDAVHVLGQYRCWSVKAAEFGAALWARQLDIGVEQFCEQVVRKVELQLGRAIIAAALAEEKHAASENQDSIGSLFIDRALSADNSGIISVDLNLQRPLVAIGAPVPSYLPAVARKLNAHLYIPENPGIDNALGAAVAGVVQTVRILIQSLDEGNLFKVHLPYEVQDFYQLEEAVAWAQQEAQRLAQENAHRAGAEEVQVHLERRDRVVKGVDDLIEEIYIDTEVIATAVGRPKLATE
jgi:N-methylhydantoinase A/oxoprolinase/acetone carboxylase beta subunit